MIKKRIFSSVTAVILLCTMLLALSGCRGAVCISELKINDAVGAGERVCYIYSPAVNDSYISQGEAQAKWLTEYLISAIGANDAAAYVIKYEGKVSNEEAALADSLYEMTAEERSRGYHLFSMTYNFSDIKDYNRKTSRLYNLSKSLAADSSDDNYRVGILDDYVDTLLRVTDIKDKSGISTGKSSVTLSESGAVSYGAVAWAFIALYKNRSDTSIWHTDEIYFAPFSPDETHTVFSALKTQLTVTLGDTVRTVTPITGQVIEGQGEVEGIVFNVTADMPSIEKKEVPKLLIIGICIGALPLLMILIIVAVHFLKGKKK